MIITPTLDIEKSLWKQEFRYIAGLDEVGRGCFAGPVVAGAVIFPYGVILPEGLADSKLLKPRQRERLAREIKEQALCWSVSEISVAVINKIGIGKATQMAFRKAIKILPKAPDYILIDAFNIRHLNRKRQKAVKDGDTICASISAASIIAKVFRDKLMKKLHKKYPEYGFAKHKGYGTKRHQEAIKKYGLTRLHRKSFNLMAYLSKEGGWVF